MGLINAVYNKCWDLDNFLELLLSQVAQLCNFPTKETWRRKQLRIDGAINTPFPGSHFGLNHHFVVRFAKQYLIRYLLEESARMSVEVTVHLFGGSVLVSLDSLGYKTLEETICAEFPDLVGSLPNFSEHTLRLSYKEGKKAKAKKNTTINPRTKPESFPVLCLEWLEISICFVINVNIY